MRTSGLRSAAAVVVGLSVALASAGACNLNFSNQAEAHDEWKRSYTLAQGGTLEIRNTNGRIDVAVGRRQRGRGDRSRAASTRRRDEAAKDGLAKFEIGETATPNADRARQLRSAARAF